MKNYSIKNLFLSSIAFSLLFISCADYVDVNNDLNNPQVSQLKPDNLLASATSDLATLQNVTMNQLGNIMTAGWSANATDFNSPFRAEFQYDMTPSFYENIWTNIYLKTNNYSHIEKYEDGQNWDNHKAIAKILKTFYLQYVVDLYGDAPFSEIHQGAQILFPKYDDDMQIYRSLVQNLDDAVALINNTNASTVRPISSEDIVFAGNMQNWKRFANTIKLRLLLRQSLLTDGATVAYLTSEFNELTTSGAQFITANVVANPGYINTDGKQNPFYASYGRDPQGNTVSANNLVGPSKYYADLLKGVIPGTLLYDPRINQQYKARSTSNPAIIGVPQGASSGRTSRLGAGVLINSNQNSYVMLAAESYLLQAEAVERGYLTGSAQGLFNSGITSSFATLGLTGTVVSNYIASSSGTSRIGWGAGNNIEAIITQKWIANNSINGIESWVEYTRTGFPSNLPLPLVTTQTSRPNRLLYPSSEISGNSNNVPPQTSSSAFTTKVFWDAN